jgi:hypothetical protein
MKFGLPRRRNFAIAEAKFTDFHSAIAFISRYSRDVLSFDFVLYKRKSEMLFYSTELSIDPARNVRGSAGIGWQLSGDVYGHRDLV